MDARYSGSTRSPEARRSALKLGQIARARYGGGGSWTTYALEKITCRNLICCVGLTGTSISAGCGST